MERRIASKHAKLRSMRRFIAGYIRRFTLPRLCGAVPALAGRFGNLHLLLSTTSDIPLGNQQANLEMKRAVVLDAVFTQ